MIVVRPSCTAISGDWGLLKIAVAKIQEELGYEDGSLVYILRRWAVEVYIGRMMGEGGAGKVKKGGARRSIINGLFLSLFPARGTVRPKNVAGGVTKLQLCRSFSFSMRRGGDSWRS